MRPSPPLHFDSVSSPRGRESSFLFALSSSTRNVSAIKTAAEFLGMYCSFASRCRQDVPFARRAARAFRNLIHVKINIIGNFPGERQLRLATRCTCHGIFTLCDIVLRIYHTGTLRARARVHAIYIFCHHIFFYRLQSEA